MNLPTGLKAEVEMKAKDWIHIAVMLVGLGTVYGGISARLSSLDEHMTTLDNRVFDMARSGSYQKAALHFSTACPQDATRVHFTPKGWQL